MSHEVKNRKYYSRRRSSMNQWQDDQFPEHISSYVT